MDKLENLKITCIGQLLGDGSGVGGGARFKNMINLFNDLGMEVNLIYFSFWGEKFNIKHEKKDKMKITSIQVSKGLPKFLKVFIIFPVLFYSLKYSRKSDIMFSDFITEIAYVPSVLMGKLFNKPIILDYIDRNFFKYNVFLRKIAAQNVDLVYAISYFLKNNVEKEYGCNNAIYLPNFIDINLFKSDKSIRETKRKELGIKDDEIVIGYAGSVGHNEGFHILIEAFKNLRVKFPKLKLAFMGKVYFDGETDIKNFLDDDISLEKDVILIPSQPYENVPSFLSAFDILCCPKIDSELNRAANPVKVVEYISMGLPTVCSSVGGIVDTIQDCDDGFLITPGDVKSLEKRIEWILLNPNEANIIAKNGRKSAEEKFSYNALKKTVTDSIIKLNI